MSRRRARGGLGLCGVLVVTACLAWPAQSRQAADEQETAARQAERQRELDHLLQDLRDGELDIARRRRAAVILLDRHWPEADAALRRLLTHADDPSTPRAIAQAVLVSGAPSPSLVVPLMRLLDTTQEALRSDVAAALGRFDEPSLVRLVASLAMAEGRSEALRLGATQTLAWYRTQQAASALIVVLDRAAPQSELSRTALASLAHLTGLHHLEQDIEAWNRWWSGVSGLDETAWRNELMRNLATRNADLDQRLLELTSRLTDTYTQLYDASAEETRQAILQKMLHDDLPGIRLKALKIVEQRVQNAQLNFSPGVLSAIRDRLFDPHTETRAQAAYVLENLKDVPGARLATELLPTENQTLVQAALLKLLTRVPQREAVDTVLPMLGSAELRGPAAAFLTAAYDANSLEPVHIETALRTIRRWLASNPATVGTATLRLFGRIAAPEDQSLVLPFLTGSDVPLAVAAVEAFDNEAWSITPLLQYLGHPQLQQAVWKVMGKRASSAQALMSLLDHEPKTAESLAAWKPVAVAIVARLSAQDVSKVDAGLSVQSPRRELHELLLKAAAGLNDEAVPLPNGNGSGGSSEAIEARKAEAELCLARLYTRYGEPSKAKTAYTRLLERPALGVEARRRAELGRLELLLTQQAYDDAAAQTQLLLADAQAPSVGQLAAVWLDATDKAVAINKTADAGTLAARIGKLFDGKLDAAHQARFTELKTKLAPMAESRGEENKQ